MRRDHIRKDETMTAANTVSSTTPAGTERDRVAHVSTARLAQTAGSLLRAIGSRWNALVDAGQLGPSTETMTSRHTGGRI
jgi:hypothetical protein